MKVDFGEVLSASSALRLSELSRGTKKEPGSIGHVLTYFFRSGVLVAGIGWLVLIALASFSISVETSMTEAVVMHVALLSRMAEGIIITGFGLAILDAIERNRVLSSRAVSSLQSKIVSLQRIEVSTMSTPTIEPRGEPVAVGSLNGREYKLFSDGSVEMETILGKRRFASILDAREFVG